MFFGKDEDFKGNPPPILHLSGYGDHMFDKVPVIVQSFNVELRAGVDYISTRQDRVYKNPTAAPGGFDPENLPQTWAPTLSTVSAGVIPIYSRESLTKFSLKDFASGTISNETNIGFI
jgi:hypothetical protein